MSFELLNQLANHPKTDDGIEYPTIDGGLFDIAFAVSAHNNDVQGGMVNTKMDADYDFDSEKDHLAEGLSPESAKTFKEGRYFNKDEAIRARNNFMKTDYLNSTAVSKGFSGEVGLALGTIADWTTLLGAGGAALGYRAATATRAAYNVGRAARAISQSERVGAIAETVAKNASASIGFDATATGAQIMQNRASVDDLDDTIVTGLAVTGLFSAPFLVKDFKALGAVQRATLDSMAEGANPMKEMRQGHDAYQTVRQDADEAFKNSAYEKEETFAHKFAAPSRHSQTTNTEIEEINAWGNQLFQDPTYLRSDVGNKVQAITADVDADKWVMSLEGELGEKLHAGKKAFLESPEGKAWRKKNGISWWDTVLDHPINEKLAYDIHRHLTSGLPIESLPAGMRDMAEVLDSVTERTLKQMKLYGVDGAEGLAHERGHMRRIHDDQAYRDLLHSFGDVKVGEEVLTKSLTEAIVRGSGGRIRGALGRRLSLILQHRVLALGDDKMALESILTSPKTFYKEAVEFLGNEKDALQMTREAFAAPEWELGDRAKYKAGDTGNDTMLKHKIPMDLSTPIGHGKVNKWGDEMRVSDLMDTNAFTLTHKYIRRGMGNAALAKRGLKSVEDVDNLLAQLRSASKFAKNGQKTEEAIQRMEEGIRRIRGVGAIEEVSGARAKAAVISSILGQWATGVGLGGSAISAMSELARVVNRVGFKSILDNIPALRNPLDKKLLNEFKEFGTYYANTRLMGQFSHLEDFGSNAIGASGALASRAAQAALKFSGMALLDKTSREAALIGWARDIERQIVTGKRATKGFRLSEMGWKPEVFDKISGYVKKHGMNLTDWRLPDGRIDHQTVDAFTSGGHKVVSENITRMLSGESTRFIDGSVASMLLQFRKMVYATYNKSLVRSLSQFDAITASNALAGLMGAVLVGSMRTAVKTAGMSDRERKEYMKKFDLLYAMQNDDGNFAQAVIGTLSYTPSGGPLGELTAMFGSMFFGVDLRGRHQSGPQTILQSPALQLTENLGRLIGGVAISPFQDDPNYKDMVSRAQAITPLQNWYGIPLLKNSIVKED
ncbi:hypothetical protein [Aeromonas veronii]|uniref:hypothetical protein n=1 Tax=Aeromonas veronii TaxID=654 RepID=UPI003BA3515B